MGGGLVRAAHLLDRGAQAWPVNVSRGRKYIIIVIIVVVVVIIIIIID